MNMLKRDLQETGNGPGRTPDRESDLNPEAESKREGGRIGGRECLLSQLLASDVQHMSGDWSEGGLASKPDSSVTLLLLLASLQEV